MSFLTLCAIIALINFVKWLMTTNDLNIFGKVILWLFIVVLCLLVVVLGDRVVDIIFS